VDGTGLQKYFDYPPTTSGSPHLEHVGEGILCANPRGPSFKGLRGVLKRAAWQLFDSMKPCE